MISDYNNNEYKFIKLLKKSNRKSIDNRSVEELYNTYLSKLDGRFPIEEFARNLGLEIEVTPLPINESGKIEGTKITVNSKDVPYRRNFTIAHEVAHYILEHGNKIDHRANIKYNPKQQSQEAEADYVAGCILLPEKIVKNDVESFKKKNELELLGDRMDEIIYELSEKFFVSTTAVIVRLKGLGYISGWVVV